MIEKSVTIIDVEYNNSSILLMIKIYSLNLCHNSLLLFLFNLLFLLDYLNYLNKNEQIYHVVSIVLNHFISEYINILHSFVINTFELKHAAAETI